MDKRTIDAYEKNSEQFIQQYKNTAPTRLYELVKTFFIPNGLTLDLGCGSGRDLTALSRQGFNVEGVEPVSSFVKHCHEKLPSIKVTQDSLPELAKIKNSHYKNIFISAVLMHLDNYDLISSVQNISRVCKPNGRIIASIRSTREDNDRESDDRLFNNIPSAKLINLFESFGTKLLFKESQTESERNITWHTFVFEKSDRTLKSGLDSIQEIIAKDKKDSSYKFALLRALEHIARFEQGSATYTDERDLVLVPMKRVAFYWSKFYFPFVSQGYQIKLRQSGPSLAFQSDLANLASNRNDFANLINRYENGETIQGFDKALKEISKTIRNQPMKFITNQEEQVFKYQPKLDAELFIDLQDSELGMIAVPADIWRDLIHFGHWIEDSIVMQWARFTERINQSDALSTYLEFLINPIRDERTTSDIRRLYENQEVECVWTSDSITTFEVDHVIPYSIWFNNDLWNLLPSSPSANNKKKAQNSFSRARTKKKRQDHSILEGL